MSETKPFSLRSTRKPRHGWFDYEVFDVFGDELGEHGLSAYITLTRLCYGGYRVKLSLREMAAHARMNKDTFARGLRRLVETGLVIERKGMTPRSCNGYDLVDVKDLVAERLKGGATPSIALTPVDDPDADFEWSSVSQLDRSGVTSVTGAEALSSEIRGANAQQWRRDAAGSPLRTVKAAGAPEPPGIDEPICLTVRQIEAEAESEPPDDDSETHLSQNDPNFETDLSQGWDALNKKQELKLNPLTPLPPMGVSEPILPFADCRPRGPGFAASLGIAARWVMGECGLVDPKLQGTICAALKNRCEKASQTLQAVAQLAVKNHRLYVERKPLLRIEYGMSAFWGHGHWEGPEAWPIDRARQERAATARIGMGPAPPSEAEQREQEHALLGRVTDWVRSKAAEVEGADGLSHFAGDLRAVAEGVDGTADYQVEYKRVSQALDDIEERMYQEALAASPPDELAGLRSQARTRLAPLRRNYSAESLAHSEADLVRRLLCEAHHVPLLSLYYMSPP